MDEPDPPDAPDGPPLRRGWTTGACATAAAKSALVALLTGRFEDPVTITLPGGQTPAFALAHEAIDEAYAEAGIIKDAGDDPDVTHGALVISRVSRGAVGTGVRFAAGRGVGTVTRPGLPLAVGEPAINPVPRRMIGEAVAAVSAAAGVADDFLVTVGVENGERLAEKTWNPRLGIIGGLSILGTTGIVIPYSCSAWIHSIQRGIDVARATGQSHIVGSTGDRSERAALARLGLPPEAAIDMGDFVGGMLKYVRTHPVERVTISGGFAKLAKLAQGAMDLHSARSTVDLERLAQFAAAAGAPADVVDAVRAAGSANEALGIAARYPLADMVADAARQAAQDMVRDAARVDVLVIDRAGSIVGESPR